ncbi:uncharacterized protein C8A04DRAFT_40505 [Dichotomopilus funicola]|uniref:Carrier domain-containing protein n=1 Tax=Dichotomopilus funicola TaxID=1934379 RepID=A0AAN6ZII9_9PEZI|nr:hypothetical protein C8A04DRAFT_40505 [Dichotomopilus funicola]
MSVSAPSSPFDRAALETRWREYLRDAPPPAFPHRQNSTAATAAPTPGAILRRKIRLPKSLSVEHSQALIQIAWCLVIVYYTDAEDVVIGLLSLPGQRGGQDDGTASRDSEERTRGGRAPASMPFRFHMQPQQPIIACLDAVLRHDQDLARHPFGTDDLARLGPDLADATNFGNQLIIHGEANADANAADTDMEIPLDRAINLECTLARTGVTTQVVYDDAIISRTEMQCVLTTFAHLLQQLADPASLDPASNRRLGDLNPASPDDVARVADWNEHVPSPVNDCMHHMVERMAQQRPLAEAVCAHGLGVSLSYQQLDIMADKLAHHLVAKGAGPGHIVPFMFEKSPWVIPSLLAINKAGAAFAPLDPAHDWQDTQGLLQACEGTFVLCSPTHQHRFAEHGVDAVVVEPALFDSLPTLGRVSEVSDHQVVRPAHPGYVIFTSGSSGTPKGVVCGHSAWCTNTAAHGPREFHSTETRLLQFSAYTFDISITDIFTTLAFGGTVCVPTEHERLSDIAGAINRMRVNHAALTPTVARFLRPKAVPTLKVLVTGGEEMPEEIMSLWAGVCRLVNSYGPAECTSRVACSLKSAGDTPSNIGTRMGAALWVTRSDDPTCVVPIGAVGELLVEGNILGNGYLKDDEKTRAAFIDAPEWLRGMYPEQEARNTRVYRTGDLVRQMPDGSFVFVGRRDAQIKVHGVRVEAGHIEAKIKRELPEDARLVVDKVNIAEKQSLAAFIKLPNSVTPENGADMQLLPVDDAIREFVYNLRRTLLAALPSYMVPSHLLVVNTIPLGVTGKVNKRAVQTFVRNLSAEQLNQFTGSASPAAASNGTVEKPYTEAEAALSKLWAEVLGVDPASIGRQDTFLGLGGDSVLCMKLVSEAATTAGLRFSVADIFQYSTLAELGQFVSDGSGKSKPGAAPPSFVPEPTEPFELVGGLPSFLQLRGELRKTYKLAANRVEDVLPATPMQEGMMAETVAHPEAYILQEVLQLSRDVDTDRLQDALETLVEAYPILRTCIVRLKDHGTCQVVLSDSEPVEVGFFSDDLHAFLARDKKQHMGYGEQLSRFAIISDPAGEQERYLVWTSHHAITDGHMHRLVLQSLERAYNDDALGIPEIPAAIGFSQFVKYCVDPDKKAASLDHWRKEFAGFDGNGSHYPSCPDTYEPSIDKYVSHHTPLSLESTPSSRSSVTPAVLLRASWMMVLSQANNSSEVVMGVTQSGRDIDLPGVHECIGPCLATMPIRTGIDGIDGTDSTEVASLSQYLTKVQRQYVDAIPHQHVGLQHIRKASDECANAVGFRNLLVVQPSSANDSKLVTAVVEARNAGDQLNFGLLLECTLSAEGVNIRAGFDSSLLSENEVVLLMQRLEHVHRQLGKAENGALPLSSLDMVSPLDLRLLESFNPDVPPSDSCLHWMIEEQARRQPDALMVDAWDARLTYREANEYSDRLAGVLVDLGVGPEVMVPFAFEKSAWATVAIHAILKAGGACVGVDMAHPRERHQRIMVDTEARVVIASTAYASSLEGLGVQHIVAVDRHMLDELPPLTSRQPASTAESTAVIPVPVSPSNAAWVVYSSGSTGVPKGSVLEHRSLCSTSRTNSEVLGVGPSTRAIHFASYAFDVAIEENVIIPMYGGCVCIPSDEQRLSNLPGVMQSMEINWADLTPTVARLLSPENAPFLRTLVLGGESLTKDIIDTWAGLDNIRLFNTYGPSECSIQCTSSKALARVATGANIGQPVNCKLWVVDADDPRRLLPVGATGELLIEGPIVGRGYLNQPAKTAAAFIQGLPWATTNTNADGPSRRFYRTGDLAKFNHDGTLDCLGRQDSQIKLHGQRIELGEIEYNITKRLSVPDASQVAVEAFTPGGLPPSSSRNLLAAFIQFSDTDSSHTASSSSGFSSSGLAVMDMNEALRKELLRIKSEASQHLPVYMIPSLLIPLHRMPTNTSGKIDRKRLREEAGKFDQRRLALYSLSETAAQAGTARTGEGREAKASFSSPSERALAVLWAETIGIDLDENPIGPDDSFLELGGDSITAMQLVGKAAASGLGLSVPRILKAPKLRDMAAAAVISDERALLALSPPVSPPVSPPLPLTIQPVTNTATQLEPTSEPTSPWMTPPETPTPLSEIPFSLSATPFSETPFSERPFFEQAYFPFQLVSGKDQKVSVADIVALAAKACDLDRDLVQDIYPATPLQEGMMALTADKADSYVLRDVYELPDEVAVERFTAAWDAVARDNPILRTRLVFIQGLGTCQVVVDEKIPWHQGNNLDEYLSKDRSSPLNYGTSLARFAIIDDGKRKFFLWTVHHALYDGYSMDMTLAAVDHAYQSQTNLAVPGVLGVLDRVHTRPFAEFMGYLGKIDKETLKQFWTHQLKDLETCPFPASPPGHRCQADNTVMYSIPFSLNRKTGITMATLLKAAWGILVSRLSESHDVVYGVTQSGRDLELAGIERINGPTITTVPLRMKIDGQRFVREFLKQLQTQTVDMIPFSHVGIQNIKNMSGDATHAACDFQNLLVIQPGEDEQESALFKKHTSATTANYLGGYGLVVECALESGEIVFSAHHDSSVISSPQLERVLRQLEHLLHQLQAHSTDKGTGRIRDLDMFSPADRADLVAWNSNFPKVINECIHDIISRNAAAAPSSVAIASSDGGNITRQELEELSNHLAHQLRDLGVGPEVLVPICIEKSPEAIIAMLAIQKAGGGFVPLNPTDPKDRLLDLLDQVAATVVIFSEHTEHLCSDLVSSDDDANNNNNISPVVLPKTLAQWAPLKTEPVTSSGIKPSNLAYALFTSGSTGRPKAVMIEHVAVSSSTYGHGMAMGFADFPRRTVQFASYTFDACIAEIFTALHFGGCICVPTEHERRNDLSRFIRDMQCDWAFFTPSFVRLLQPDDIPSMKTVVLGGEALNQECIDVWADKVHLMNGYGPTETCVFTVTRTMAGTMTGPGARPETIGHPVSSIGWVVDPNDHHRLTPVGCVGELLIQGPNVARGYLANPEKTAESFVQSPKWMRAFGHTNTAQLLYKTGDLVRQDAEDGSLTYLGRKDNQTKVNGQRLELGEIETQLRTRGDKVESAVVLATKAKTQQKLAAFVQFSLESNMEQDRDTVMMEVDDAMVGRLQQLESTARAALPSYMVPSLWIPVTNMPTLDASGKTDRKTLASLLGNLTPAQTTMYSLGTTTQEQDSAGQQEAETGLEKTLVELVARILGLRAEDIGRHDSFFRLGGDSITAIQLVASARAAGITLSSEAIFRRPSICDMAMSAELARGGALGNPNSKIDPYSLVPVGKRTELLNAVERKYGIEKSSVADLLPCSPLQEGLISLTIQDPEAYVLREIYRLPTKMDMDRFKSAWESVVKDAEVLRTRIVHLDENGCYQVVMNQDGIPWHNASKVQEYIDHDKAQLFEYGAPLARFALVETENTGCYFVWSIHHALYDGWSKTLIMKHVQEAYNLEISPEPPQPSQPAPATNPTLAPYNRFIEYLQRTNPSDSHKFWKAQFDGLEAQPFPRPPSASFKPILDGTLTIKIPWARTTAASQWTTATVLKAAWALVLSRHTGAPDALFGAVQSGRNVPIPGISDMIGPTITTVPMRIRVQGEMPLATFLKTLQDQGTDMMRHEHLGLQNISKISAECREACAFTNIMVIQPGQQGGQAESELDLMGATRIEDQDKGFLRFNLGLECALENDAISVTGGYDRRLLSGAQMRRLLRQFETAILDINDKNNEEGEKGALVRDINLVSADDLAEMAEMAKMNETPSDDDDDIQNIQECTHDVIHRVAMERGGAMAVNAWDVDFQYIELDQLSTKLAYHLRSLGVGPESVVPLCFEKSGWAVVAVLGVLKAGAAFVFLDPGYPMARLSGIVRQVNASVILASLGQAPLWRGSHIPVVVIDNVSIELLPSSISGEIDSGVKPSNAVYLIFTSGSTGEPKGCVIEHHSFLTCARAQASRTHMTRSSRVLQGASYSFDVSVMEMLTALMVGACVCVPNDSIRKRSAVDVINDFRITWTFLTPSIVKFIKPADIPHLKTLVLGGEALTRQNIRTWAGHLRLINGYGPSECTIAAAVHVITHAEDDPANIGKALGGLCWITDPDDHNKLAPLGTIGELVVEGNIVARGYLNKPEKTAEVFIENPAWVEQLPLPDGRGSGTRRVYKTGDLAYFSTDGDIMFMGRKDAQVKVRGQRMELGEIETHLTRDKKIQHAMVAYPASGPCKRQLVGILSFERLGATTNSSGEVVLVDPTLAVAENVTAEVAEMARHLSTQIPSYMMPEIWVVVQSFPLLLSGKLNRKRVDQWLASLDKATHQRICGIGASFRVQQPSTQAEQLIHKVWVDILKLPADEVGVTQEFTTLGGDSILAMLVVAKLKALALRVTMTDVVSARTIAGLAARITRIGGDKLGAITLTPSAHAQVPEETGELFDLSPMQQFYANFALKDDYLSQQTNKNFNHTFCLAVKQPPLSAEAVRGAFEALVKRHGMLRARFQRDAAAACGWRQYISADAAGSFRFRNWENVTVKKIKPALEEARQGLDIETGPLMAVDLVTVSKDKDGEQYLMIVAHHLVVDLVSWNTILGDLEAYLRTQSFASEAPYPFSAWAREQQQYAIQNFPPSKALPRLVPSADYNYWGMEDRACIARDAAHYTVSLSKRDTTTLLTTCNRVYGAEPMDVLCSSLAHSFRYVFRDRPPPTVFRYGHGREQLNNNQAGDPSSGTVGWFTTLSPIQVSVPKRKDDSISVLQRTIEARESLPVNGLAFFASRYHHPAGPSAFGALDLMEVSVNYLGVSDNQQRGGSSSSASSLFDMSNAIHGGLGADEHEVKAFSLFSISAEVKDGKFTIQCSWSKKSRRQTSIREWFYEYGNALKDVAHQVRKRTKDERKPGKWD